MRIVVCGGGIVGVSVAYHLALRGVQCTVVERCGVACAASGKAGGFLARDWCDSYELGPLARLSFDLHMKMADTMPQCEYRRLDTLSIAAREGTGARGQQRHLPNWLDGGVVTSARLGNTQTTAQVHPYKLTHAMMDEATRLAGSKVVNGVVEGVDIEGHKVRGVKVNGDVIPADVVVLALGPWSWQVAQWFNIPSIKGQRAHHVIVDPQSAVSAHALFVEYQPRSGESCTPEVYPRPDGQVYVCGMSDKAQLPDDPAQIQIDQESCKKLKQIAGDLSTQLDKGEVIRQGACYLPVSPDGLPLIGSIPGCNGVYIAAGHSCWGILTGPGTGLALSELILDGKAKSVDLAPFDPKRDV